MTVRFRAVANFHVFALHQTMYHIPLKTFNFSAGGFSGVQGFRRIVGVWAWACTCVTFILEFKYIECSHFAIVRFTYFVIYVAAWVYHMISYHMIEVFTNTVCAFRYEQMETKTNFRCQSHFWVFYNEVLCVWAGLPFRRLLPVVYRLSSALCRHLCVVMWLFLFLLFRMTFVSFCNFEKERFSVSLSPLCTTTYSYIRKCADVDHVVTYFTIILIYKNGSFKLIFEIR